MTSPPSRHQNQNLESPCCLNSNSWPSHDIAVSPIRNISPPPIETQFESEGLPSPVVAFGKDGARPFQEYEDDKENEEDDAFDFDLEDVVVELGEDAFCSHRYDDRDDKQQKRFCSTPSPRRNHHHPMGSGGRDGTMRQHLLVQRTFNHHEDGTGPLTSSPMRKIPAIAVASPGGLTPMTPCTSKYSHKESCTNGCYANIGSTPQFKTPVRGQRDRDNPSDRDHLHVWERTPSASRTPAGFMSPASSVYAFSTPGRQFVNPFEADHERLHLPVLTPSMDHVKHKEGESSAEKEGFWTIEQRALMMPVEIKESEILRQHFYQTKRDKEMEPLMQKAVDRFFAANELIVPSPWSEQKGPQRSGPGGGGRLVQTPTGAKMSGVARSVSCQTAMSVPPDVDLMAELADKYRLPDDQLVRESPVDSSLAGSFIRRKLLHQLNENDNDTVGASPELPLRTQSVEEHQPSSVFPSPTKQVTPELEKQTPNKKSSGHFSSSPIRSTGDRGNHPAMSESDLLASPELSPIAGRGSNKPLRSSDMFTPRQEFERSREIMQLDFSSILDEPDDFDNANVSDRTGTLIQIKERNSDSCKPGSVDVDDDNNGYSEQQEHHQQQRFVVNTPSTNNNPYVMADVGDNVIEVEEEAALLSSSSLSSSLRYHSNNDNNSSYGGMGSGSGHTNRFNNTLRKPLIMSGLSAESSTQDILLPTTNLPNSLMSQDTGYQTASSLQSITNLDCASNLQSQLQDVHSSSALSSCCSTSGVNQSSAATTAHHSSSCHSNTTTAQSKVLFVPLLSSSTTSSFIESSSNVNLSTAGDAAVVGNNNCCNKDHCTLHMSFTNKHNNTGIVPNSNNANSIYKSADLCAAAGEDGNSLDSYLSSGTRLSYLFSDNDSNNDLDFYSHSFTRGQNNCRVRKIRTLSDIRRSREKSNASRDLTSSFNEEAKSASTVIVRLSRSLSNPSINMDSAAAGTSTTTVADCTTPSTADLVADEDDGRDGGEGGGGRVSIKQPDWLSRGNNPDLLSSGDRNLKGEIGRMADGPMLDSANAMNVNSDDKSVYSVSLSLPSSSSNLEKRLFENIDGVETEERHKRVAISKMCADDSDDDDGDCNGGGGGGVGDNDIGILHSSNKFIKLLTHHEHHNEEKEQKADLKVGGEKNLKKKNSNSRGNNDSAALFLFSSLLPSSSSSTMGLMADSEFCTAVDSEEVDGEVKKKNSLEKARELLGKSEALRMQHDDEGIKHRLEMDTFYQYISDPHADDDNDIDYAKRQSADNAIPLPRQQRRILLQAGSSMQVGGSMDDDDGGANYRSNSSSAMMHPSLNLNDKFSHELMSETEKQKGLVGATSSSLSSLRMPLHHDDSHHHHHRPVLMSTSDDDDAGAAFDSVEEKINSIKGVRLGSEIAAEILKRAGEDLAQFRNLVDGSCSSGSGKSAPSSQ